MIRKKTIRLELEQEAEIPIQKIRTIRKMPFHLFFFSLNKHNSFPFYRIKDFVLEKDEKRFEFLQFEGTDNLTKNSFKIIKHKSFQRLEQNMINGSLFGSAEINEYLFTNLRDVDYILIGKEKEPDFSIISFPENLIFPVQEDKVKQKNLLYQYILENE